MVLFPESSPLLHRRWPQCPFLPLEIIDYLFEETLPILKETLVKVSQRQRYMQKENTQEEKSCKKTFRFDDIFQDMLEDELLDSSDGETGEPSQADDWDPTQSLHKQ